MKKTEELSQQRLLTYTCFNYLLEALIEYIEQGSNVVDIKNFIGKLGKLRKLCIQENLL